MRLTRSTRIQSGDQKLMLNQLANDTKMHVSVKFVPERSGDISRLVQITGRSILSQQDGNRAGPVLLVEGKVCGCPKRGSGVDFFGCRRISQE